MRLEAERALRDPEILNVVGDDPALLAIVDAIYCTQPPRTRRSSRRIAPLLASAFAAAAIGLLLVAPWQTGPGLVARALAAVGERPVIHVVTSQPLNGISTLDLKTGRLTAGSTRTDVFFDADRKLERSVSSSPLDGTDDELHTASGDWVNGVPVWTCARIAAYPAAAARARVSCPPGSSTRPQPPQLDPALADFAIGYRAALASGRARHIGDGSLNGRHVYWLAIGSDERVAVDAATLLPVLVRQTELNAVTTYRVLSFVTEAYSAAEFTRAKPVANPPAVSESVHGTRTISLAQARAVLGRSLVVPRRLVGLRFEDARFVSLLSGYDGKRPDRHSLAVDLVFRNGDQQLVLQESRQPNLIAGFSGPAVVAGEALVLERSNGNLSLADEGHWAQGGIPIAPWRATLLSHGTYIAIDSWSKPLLAKSRATSSRRRVDA